MEQEERDWEELRLLQEKNKEIFQVVDDFCEKNHLMHYLCGGACIGALRHKDMIPWDDDIDMMMPRGDYEQFCRLWPEQMADTPYVLCRNDETHFYRSLMTAVVDTRTTFIKERQADLEIPHGIRVEVFPIDAVPDGKLRRRLQILYALLYQIYTLNEPPVSRGKLLYVVGRILLAFTPNQRRRYRAARFFERKMSKTPITGETRFITELCSRYHYMRNDYPAQAFSGMRRVPFGKGEAPIPVGAETYLTMAYGSYMELPPKEDQKPKHDALVVDVEKSYESYRGTAYPIEYVPPAH